MQSVQVYGRPTQLQLHSLS